MIERLGVQFVKPDGSVIPVGELAFDLATNQHEFRYSSEFLSAGIELCPGYLPLENRLHTSQESFAVFRGSLPDNWGMTLLARTLPRSMQAVPYFLAAINIHGLGALRYTGALVERVAGSVPELQDSQSILTSATLDDMAEAVAAMDAGQPVDRAMLRKLLAYGTSPGGARPKCLVDAHGSSWIAKFPSVKDDCDVVALEHACMSAAGMAGINVPDIRYETWMGKRVLLVKRFDITGQGGRNHMLSMATLMGIAGQGWYQRSYKDLGHTISQVSVKPELDLEYLFRQMVFNAVIGNTDDHLFNFMVLHTGNGYRLSPAYDLVPNIGRNQEHTLFFDYDGYTPGKDTLRAIGTGAFRLSDEKAESILNQVIEVGHGMDTLFVTSGVPEPDAAYFARDIKGRLNQITGIA